VLLTPEALSGDIPEQKKDVATPDAGMAGMY
jgi:hypothetical protein